MKIAVLGTGMVGNAIATKLVSVASLLYVVIKCLRCLVGARDSL
jgi:predicted dinucleotide-binding enzyme